MGDWLDVFKDRKEERMSNKIAWVGPGYYKESKAYGSWIYVGKDPDYSLRVRVEFFNSEEEFHKQEG